MQTWQLQEAKAKFSELVRKANFEGPQEVTVRGQDQVVVVSKKMFEEFLCPKLSFWQLMESSPLYEIELDMERERSLSRDISI